jgi:hypothetical protein
MHRRPMEIGLVLKLPIARKSYMKKEYENMHEISVL